MESSAEHLFLRSLYIPERSTDSNGTTSNTSHTHKAIAAGITELLHVPPSTRDVNKCRVGYPTGPVFPSAQYAVVQIPDVSLSRFVMVKVKGFWHGSKSSARHP
jgi:hypothetical protein